jgi:hypothetical protein
MRDRPIRDIHISTTPPTSVGGMQDMQKGAYPKKKKSFAGQFAAVKYRSETYSWTKQLNREDYGVDKYWVHVFF